MMPSVTVNLNTEIILTLDKERRWVSRSQAVNKALDYLLNQSPGTVRMLCGADKLPPEYTS